MQRVIGKILLDSGLIIIDNVLGTSHVLTLPWTIHVDQNEER